MTLPKLTTRQAADTEGQDIVEYALLLGFLVLTSAALYIETSNVIDQIWQTIATRLADGA